MREAEPAGHPNRDYWKTYGRWFGARTIREAEAALRADALDLGTERVLLDRFEPEGEAKGTILCVHGVTGCARQAAPVLHAMSRAGWRAAGFDLIGFGWEAGGRVPWTMEAQAERVARAIRAVRARLDGPLYVSGASLGAAIVLHAAGLLQRAGEKPAGGLALFAVADLSLPEARRALSRWGPLTGLGVAAARLGGRAFPSLPVPLRLLASDRGVNEDAALRAHVRADPGIPPALPLGAVGSILSSRPPVPFERLREPPALVFAPEGDRTIPNALTRAVYERLGCPKRWDRMAGADHWRPSDAGVRDYLAPQLRFFDDLRAGRGP